MKKENEKKKVILMIVGVIALMVVVIGATFAYFQAQIGIGENTKLEATTGTTDSLTFNITDIDVTDSDNKILDENNNGDANIIINANQGNFGPADNSLGDGVNLNAHLIANNTNQTASYTYNLYLDISKNELEYTSYKYNDKVISFKTKEEKEQFEIEIEEDEYLYIDDLEPIPELVLVVQKPDGSYVDNINKLTKSEITIDGKSVPCFDITNVKDFITITNEYQIDATEDTQGEADQNWQIRVIFKNLETDQHLNTDKSFQANLSIQSEKINYLDLASYADCDEDGYCTYNDYRSDNYNSQIKNVYFVNYIADEEELNSVDKWDLSSSKDGSIMGWLKANEDESTPYDLYIGSNLKEGEKIVVRSFKDAFQELSRVETIDLNPSILDTSNLTDTSQMFEECRFLTTITGIENLDVSNVTNMSGMFSYAMHLITLNLSGWETHNVTDMSDMFFGTPSLTEIVGIGDLDVSNVTDMSGMFCGIYTVDDYEYTHIVTLDLSNWDTQNVADMSYMFSGAIGLTSLNLSGWDTSSVTNMTQMFDGDRGLTSLDMQKATFTQVKSYDYMFYNTNYTLKVTITGDANKKWFIDNNVLEEEKLDVLSE